MKLWASHGFQTVRVANSEWAADRGAAGFSREAIEQLHCPWPAFLVLTPDAFGVVALFVSVTESGLGIQVFSTDNDSCGWWEGALFEQSQRDGTEMERKFRASVALLLAVTMEFDRAGTSAERDTLRLRDGRSRRRMASLGTSEFVVGKPVRHDVGRELREWVRTGDSRSLSTTWVCGHTKMQPCGAGGGERRKIWIDTYRRGDGPMLVRDHVIGAHNG